MGDERRDLLCSQVDRYPRQRAQNIINERLRLAGLDDDEMAPTFLCDFDERIARHVLDTCSHVRLG
jgi:hypothetical protein